MSSLDAVFRYADTYEWMDRMRTGLPPVMVTCAINGGIQGRETHDRLPERPAEIAAEVKDAYEAGATAVHIHGRHPEALYEPARHADVYREINSLVRDACPEIIINNTTGGGVQTTWEQRFSLLDAAPEMASLNCGPDMSRFVVKPRPAPIEHPHGGFEFDDCMDSTYGRLEQLAQTMADRGVKPELEVYHPGQLWLTRDLIEKGLIKPPYVHQLVMGYQTSSFPTPANVIDLARDLPEGSLLFVCGIAHFQLPMTATSLILGGHVRVGLEDNLYKSRGVKFESSAEAVERVVELARRLGRELATPEQAREMLGLGAPRAFATPELSAA